MPSLALLSLPVMTGISIARAAEFIIDCQSVTTIAVTAPFASMTATIIVSWILILLLLLLTTLLQPRPSLEVPPESFRRLQLNGGCQAPDFEFRVSRRRFRKQACSLYLASFHGHQQNRGECDVENILPWGNLTRTLYRADTLPFTSKDP